MLTLHDGVIYELEVGWCFRCDGPGLLIGMGREQSDEEAPQVDWTFLDEVVEHSMYRARHWPRQK